MSPKLNSASSVQQQSVPGPSKSESVKTIGSIMTTQEFFVDMTCEGCSGAVTRVLKKLDVKFDIDLPNKKVFIESDKDTDVLLETLKKTGKTVTYIGPK
ncbi:copper transport protein ATOX1 isoform X2 [Chanodichthys erythropterus]|uniref:copper transport protein ATOX1 isoform X2 n=1 Tax=Chanodichthys erythropterus TaxID=933992 RepID=UPI00351DE075